MLHKTRIRRFSALHAFLLLTLLILPAASDLRGQAKQLLTWQDDLAYLQNLPGNDLAEQQDAVEQIRTRLRVWLKLHPDLKVELASAPARPWGVEEIRSQVALLSETVATILREDTGRPFNLGVTTISVTEEESPISPLADTANRDEIVDRQAINVAAALDYLPGVAINHISGGRNEAAMYVRGFSTKGQISLYIDGIPVSMPYDGTIDFNRILSSDIAEMQVAKGFSSPLLGANAMGGSINMVTRQPQKKYQGDILMGTGSGDLLLSSVNLGTRWQKFYFQGTFDWQQSSFFPLSGSFPLNAYQPTYKRNKFSWAGRIQPFVSRH